MACHVASTWINIVLKRGNAIIAHVSKGIAEDKALLCNLQFMGLQE